jgi:hypothetical protein
MKLIKKLTLAKSAFTFVVIFGFLLIMTMNAPAHGHFHGGFYYGGYPGWGWYSPFYYGPYYGPYYGGMYQNGGEIKLETEVKDAEVLINGAYAGTTGKLKSFRLRPGTYMLEIRAPGRTRYAQKVYVVGGKTLHIRPDLRVEEKH